MAIYTNINQFSIGEGDGYPVPYTLDHWGCRAMGGGGKGLVGGYHLLMNLGCLCTHTHTLRKDRKQRPRVSEYRVNIDSSEHLKYSASGRVRLRYPLVVVSAIRTCNLEVMPEFCPRLYSSI